MATNLFKDYTKHRTREWEVPAGTTSGQIVINAVSGEVGVALTGRGDAKRTQRLADGTILTNIDAGGVGNKDGAATVARDGSFTFPVAGVTDGETVLGTGTKQGTKVYRTAAGALNLTASGNTLVGIIDDCRIVGGVAAVEIGVK